MYRRIDPAFLHFPPANVIIRDRLYTLAVDIMHTKIERNALILYPADWTWPGVMERHRKFVSPRRSRVRLSRVSRRTRRGKTRQDVPAANREVAEYHFRFRRARANGYGICCLVYGIHARILLVGLATLHERAPSLSRRPSGKFPGI